MSTESRIAIDLEGLADAIRAPRQIQRSRNDILMGYPGLTRYFLDSTTQHIQGYVRKLDVVGRDVAIRRFGDPDRLSEVITALQCFLQGANRVILTSEWGEPDVEIPPSLKVADKVGRRKYRKSVGGDWEFVPANSYRNPTDISNLDGLFLPPVPEGRGVILQVISRPTQTECIVPAVLAYKQHPFIAVLINEQFRVVISGSANRPVGSVINKTV